jgi:hypothetical protein
MRFGGHETFTLREGWLVKGVNLLKTNPSVFFDKNELAYALGVGVNMGRSIEHWLLATKLVTKLPLKEAREKETKYQLTELALLIDECDPYMIQEETWWVLHLNLVQNPEYAATWDWFFNDFGETKFEKPLLIQKLINKEQSTSKKTPSKNTIERDVTCFLSTYAYSVSREVKDPEEDYGSPFQELRLISYQRNSGTYELLRRPRKINPELFLYSLNKIVGEKLGSLDITLSWLNKQRGGPLQIFGLTSEGLFELAVSLESIAEKYNYSIRTLAGDRQILYTNPGSIELLTKMYEGLK